MDTSHTSIFPFPLSPSLPPPCVDPPAPLRPVAPPLTTVLLLSPGTLPPLRVVASPQLWQPIWPPFQRISPWAFRLLPPPFSMFHFPDQKPTCETMVVKSWKYFSMINFPDAWSILFIALSPNRILCREVFRCSWIHVLSIFNSFSLLWHLLLHIVRNFKIL